MTKKQPKLNKKIIEELYCDVCGKRKPDDYDNSRCIRLGCSGVFTYKRFCKLVFPS